MERPHPPLKAEQQQQRDDAMRDRLLGSECFCGAKGGVQHGTLENGAKITVEQRCSPLKCLAHGYCEAHLTRVDQQMSADDKVFIVRRCGIAFHEAATGREV